MTLSEIETLYEKHYADEWDRRGLLDALAGWRSFRRVLYPGSFVHVTPSFVFPAVAYVDNDRNAVRFFRELESVVEFVSSRKTYPEAPAIKFHGCSYTTQFDEPDEGFDLLISLYAGFVSEACKRYLSPGGVLAANNSHGDAGLASVDPDFEFVGVLAGRGKRLRVVTEGLDAYFQPKKDTVITPEALRKVGRGVGYTKTAPLYLFEKVG